MMPIRLLYNGMSLLIIALFAMIFSGCATTDNTLNADYLMPPLRIKDINAVTPLSICTEVKLTGNEIGTNDSKLVQCDVTQRVAARLSSEGYYKTTDILWGDANGPAELQKLMQAKKNPHGYDLYSTSKVESARMEISLNIDIARNATEETEVVKLEYTPYKRNKGKVPSSSPNPKGISITTQKVPVIKHTLTVNGLMKIKLYDKKNKLVYEKSFENMKYAFQTGVKSISAIPVNTAVVAQMIMPAVRQIVVDISPHMKTQQVEINDDGEKKSVLLLRAHAYSEAIMTIDDLINNDNAKLADLENMAIALELIGDYQSAKSYWEQSIEKDNDSLMAKQGITRVSSILLGQHTLHKNKIRKENDFKRKLNQVQ